MPLLHRFGVGLLRVFHHRGAPDAVDEKADVPTIIEWKAQLRRDPIGGLLPLRARVVSPVARPGKRGLGTAQEQVVLGKDNSVIRRSAGGTGIKSGVPRAAAVERTRVVDDAPISIDERDIQWFVAQLL